MTQADWVKELEQRMYEWESDTETQITFPVRDELIDFIQSQITLAQQRTEKKWREKIEKVRVWKIKDVYNPPGFIDKSDLLK